MNNKKQRKIILLFVALFLFYGLINSSFSIYREVKGDSILLNILSGTTIVNFDANGGTIPNADATRSVQSGNAVGTLPTSMTRNNYVFDGWWTDPTNGTQITAQTTVTGTTVTYYAHWIKLVCKKAVSGTLHTETCDATGSCTTIGYSANDTITYGTIPGNNSPIIGDAYDCDVNDDDVWDPLTERFYYVRSYGGTTQDENSVLVHFTSFDNQGQMDSSNTRNNYLYSEAPNYLPTAATWDNPALIEIDGNITRFISRDDIAAACGSNTGGNKFRDCQFYLENTRFQSLNLGRAGLWILAEGNTHYRIHTEALTLGTAAADSKNAVRPTIEIPSNTIEDFKKVAMYTITFDPTDGALDDPTYATRRVADGSAIGNLPTATRSKYVLDGWYTAATNGTKINGNTIITGDTTYYAHWRQVELDYVFYIPGECTFTSTGITDGANGDCISTVNPTGSDIDYTDSQLSIKRYIDSGIALYGNTYHDYDYEIHFEIVDYDPEINESQATFFNTKNEANGYPGVVVRRGTNDKKLLIELASRRTSSNNTSVMLNYGTVTKVSIFRINNEIYYKLNDDANVFMNNLSEFNPVFNLTTWFGAGPTNGTATTAQRYLTGTLKNMYIKVAPNNAENATVTFDPNYQGASTFDEVYTKDEAIGTLPPLTRTGYTFLGWWTEASGGTQINENTIVDDDITYYAHWHEDVTVTLHANGGTVSPNTITVPYNTAVGTLPTPEKSGYIFAGWFSDDNTFQNEVTSSTVITSNTDFYAKWIENITVTLSPNGGTVTPSSITFAKGSAIGTLPTPERTGYDFKGWFTDDETFLNEVTSSTVFNTSTTIYAKWEETEDIIINLDADGGTVSPTYLSIQPGTEVGTLPEPTNSPDRTNYTFVAWFIDDGTYQNEVTSTTILNEDTDLIAKWVDDTYVACVGSTCYTTLAAAVNAVPTTGVKTTIRIIQDITNTTATTIPSTKWVDLDIGSHTINIATGTTNLFNNNGKLDIRNGTLTSSAGYIIKNNNNNSTLNITGGTLTFNNASDSERKVIEMDGGTINISGGTLNCNSKAAVINANGGTLNVTGGRIIGTNTTKGQAIYNNGATTNISGDAYLENTSTTNVTNGRAAVHNNAGTVNILGGTIISNQNAAVKNNDIMTIGTDDGTIDTTSPVCQGHLYGLETVSGKTVTVYDGIFKGKVSTNNKAISDESVVDKGTYTITHDSETIDNVQYDVAYLEDTSLNITLNFNVNGGDSVEYNTKTLNAEGAIGALPTATKANTEFLGWYTAQTGGERVLTTRNVTSADNGTIYYAHYTNATTVCKAATTLHTSGNTTFGTIPTTSPLSAGNAFDCDVNGDGTFDSTNERFYYLTDTNNGKAVFVYSNNVHQGQSGVSAICKPDAVNYGDNFTDGPNTAIEELPMTTEWSNVSLYTEPRTITNQSGTTITSDYIYTEKAARLANLDEIKAATSSSINETANELASYTFLLENTAAYGDCRSNYWLETTNSNGGAVRINATNKSLGHATGSSAVRPVIEVPYASIDGIINIVEFDTIPAAMRTYFNNVSSWNANQDDSDYSSFNAAMVNNLNNYNCAYYQNDNTGTEYGSVYCDQPNKYDTGITGNINVYEYDVTTGEIANTQATYVSNDNGKLYNFIPGKTYYWVSATDSSKKGYVKPTGERRLITINGTNRQTRNVRDLGGLPVDTDGNGTIDGTVKYQKLYRGEKIWGTNRDGTTKAEFEKLGIYNELDLRTQGSEIVASEEDQLTNYIPYEIVHYKIDHTEFGTPATETRFNGKSYYQLARDSAIEVMKRVVAGNDDYALYFHCRIGADRTGTLAYILEGLLGVPTEYRHQDYELTTFFGLRERTRYYYNKDTNNYKFLYLKKAIRHATLNNDEITGEENVMDWFLLEGNSTPECSDITSLINQFRTKMIDYN